MKKLITVFILLIAFNISAQEEEKTKSNSKISIGAKGGLSLPSLSDNSDNIYSKDYKSFISYEGGLFATYNFSDKWGLQLEINYARKGGERKGIQPITSASLPIPLPAGTNVYGDFDNRSDLRYLEIPILVKANLCSLGDNWKLFSNVGPYVGFLLSANQKTSGNSPIYLDEGGQIPLSIPGVGNIAVPFDAETDVKDSLEKFNVGIVGGLGVIRTISAKSDLMFEVRGTYGFIPMQKDSTFGKSKIGSAVFSLGYIYKL